MHDVALVVLARAPEHGRAKTRLARTIGDAAALTIYRSLLEITARAAGQWCGPVLLAATGDVDLFEGSGLEHFVIAPQAQGGLGSRIAAALRSGLELRPRAIAIGSDCPGLTVNHLRGVAARLQDAPAAFGPARDGGFWAIATGHHQVVDALADTALPWSTPDTLAAVRAHLAKADLASELGPLLSDCDTEADLTRAVSSGELLIPPSLATARPLP